MPIAFDPAEDPFLVTAELEVRSILRSLMRQSALIRMYVPGTPDQSILTTILALDEGERRVVVDCGADTAFNERVISAPTVAFDTQLDHVSIQFRANQLRSCVHEGLPALSFPLPSAARRVQRREFYRVDIPVSEPASCKLTIPGGGTTAPRQVVLKLKDLSAGGVALIDSENLVLHEPGVTYMNAVLTLPEVGDVEVDLEVLRIHTAELPNKKEIVIIACRFRRPAKSTTTLIQNYIGRLERRLIAKQRGN